MLTFPSHRGVNLLELILNKQQGEGTHSSKKLCLTFVYVNLCQD